MQIKRFPPILLLLIAALLVLSGYQWGVHARGGALGSVSTNQTRASQPAETDFSLFWQVWDKLHVSFVGDLNDSKLVAGAIDGMVTAAGDPYTVYLDPQAAKALGQDLASNFSGIGAEIGVKDGQLVIQSPLPGSPAEKAGLKAQDQIQKIDGKSVADIDPSAAAALIRGPAGSKVVLTILRQGAGQPQDITVTRATIRVPSVTSTIRPDKLGYIQITGFHDDTANLVNTAAGQFAKAGVKGVILDLRGNPGGLLDSAIDVTSVFLRSGVVVKQKDKAGKVTSYQVRGAASLPDVPLVVLVDKGSASAAEITAGALQDHHRAKLIGETTFGKGSVQELEDLSNGGQLKVTIAQWLTPNDRQISGKGIQPDITVSDNRDPNKPNQDAQLDRAAQELLGTK